MTLLEERDDHQNGPYARPLHGRGQSRDSASQCDIYAAAKRTTPKGGRLVSRQAPSLAPGRDFTFRSGWINLIAQGLRMGIAMISSLLAVALLWAPPPDPSIAARKAYSNCLNQFVKTTSEKKMAPAEFDTLIDTACPDKAASFRTIMVTADVKRGISRKTAEQGVEDELADFRSSAKETYRLYFEPAAGQP